MKKLLKKGNKILSNVELYNIECEGKGKNNSCNVNNNCTGS